MGGLHTESTGNWFSQDAAQTLDHMMEVKLQPLESGWDLVNARKEKMKKKTKKPKSPLELGMVFSFI